MHTHLFSSSSPPSTTAASCSAKTTTVAAIIIVLLLSIAVSTCSGQEEEQYYDCVHYNYTCGQNIQNIRYPFWGNGRPQYCGHPSFELKCQNEYATLDINSRAFRVQAIDQVNRVISLASSDLWQNYCTNELHNITLDPNLFEYGLTVRYLFLFYNCTSDIPEVFPNNFVCETDGTRTRGFYAEESFLRVLLEKFPLATVSCSKGIQVPVLRVALDDIFNRSLTLQDGLDQGFELEYVVEKWACSRCVDSGGVCGSNSRGGVGFVCHCSHGSFLSSCHNRGKARSIRLKLGIGFGASGFTLLVMGLSMFLYNRRNKNRYNSTSSWFSRSGSPYPSSTKDLEQAGTIYGVHIFKYSELEKATSHFDSKKELGDGGFGTVYQGKLKDGRVVAVKRLYENNCKRVEQFMNEVEILARLRHQNLVSLYGCTSRHCRELLLVYEYIPNGTVADHLHGDRAKPGSLSWTTRMSIAVETASALAYLHASDVIHRDVKTNNILLDNNFRVKVADFGLSRLFPNNVSHVSTAPQGTPGYVDPEYHECYQLTDRSDVYSFGVVLMELVSSKPAVDITRHRHEINLSNMAVNKIQNHALHELVDPSLGFESDFKAREMIAEVAELAFQCLQNERDLRPSMEQVLETLKRIQSEDWSLRKAEEVEIPADEVVLLKSDPPTFSPDSMAENWIN